MKAIIKIATLFVLAIMVFNLNIRASAQNRTHYDFTLSVSGNIYTSPVQKDNNNNYATVYIKNQNATASINLQICDSNHRAVSKSITICGNTNDIYNIEYTCPVVAGETYCLRIGSGYYSVVVSGYWIP